MASKFAKRIVESDSPLMMAEAFVSCLNEKTETLYKSLKEQKANYILVEDPTLVEYDEKLDAAINFVIEKIEKDGINVIAEAIVEAAPVFKVTEKDLRNVFEDAIADDITEDIEEIPTFEFFQSSFLKKIDAINESSTGDVVGFQDLSSVYVTPEEGRALAELYSNLNNENKKRLVEKLVSSKKEFNELVKFAEGVNQ